MEFDCKSIKMLTKISDFDFYGCKLNSISIMQIYKKIMIVSYSKKHNKIWLE